MSVNCLWERLPGLSVSAFGDAAGDHVTSDVATLCCEDGEWDVRAFCLSV